MNQIGEGHHRLCPGCNLPAIPVHVYRVDEDGVAGVVGLCGRCKARVGNTPSPHQKKRLGEAFAKALRHQDRFYCEVFQEPDQADIVAGMLGSSVYCRDAIELLGWYL